MFAEVLVCDGCHQHLGVWSTDRRNLAYAGERAKWLRVSRGHWSSDEWFCPTCKLAVERETLVTAKAEQKP